MALLSREKIKACNFLERAESQPAYIGLHALLDLIHTRGREAGVLGSLSLDEDHQGKEASCVQEPGQLDI